MTAALHNGKGSMEIRQVQMPEPGPGDAIVRVRQSGICGSDLMNYQSNISPEAVAGGHEVVEVGPAEGERCDYPDHAATVRILEGAGGPRALVVEPVVETFCS